MWVWDPSLEEVIHLFYGLLALRSYEWTPEMIGAIVYYRCDVEWGRPSKPEQ